MQTVHLPIASEHAGMERFHLLPFLIKKMNACRKREHSPEIRKKKVYFCRSFTALICTSYYLFVVRIMTKFYMMLCLFLCLYVYIYTHAHTYTKLFACFIQMCLLLHEESYFDHRPVNITDVRAK
jgi:hypothetical protein